MIVVKLLMEAVFWFAEKNGRMWNNGCVYQYCVIHVSTVMIKDISLDVPEAFFIVPLNLLLTFIDFSYQKSIKRNIVGANKNIMRSHQQIFQVFLVKVDGKRSLINNVMMKIVHELNLFVVWMLSI